MSQDPSSADKDNQGGNGSFLSPGAVLWLCGTEQRRKGTAARLFAEMLTFVTSVGTAGTQDFHPLFKYPPAPPQIIVRDKGHSESLSIR